MSLPTRPSPPSGGSSKLPRSERYRRFNRDVLVIPRNFAQDLREVIRKKEEEEVKIYEMEMRRIGKMKKQIEGYKRHMEYLFDSYKMAHRRDEFRNVGSDEVVQKYVRARGLDAYKGIRGDQNYFTNHVTVSSFLENTFLKSLGIDAAKVEDTDTKIEENATTEEKQREVLKEPNLSPSVSSFVENMYKYEELPDHERYKLPSL